MDKIHLKNVDLNLLVAFDVLLDERQVTKSASRLNISQPAMSRKLGRLRETFDDPIIMRTTSGYVPTVRAESLIHPIKEILKQIQGTLSALTFDPATATGEFRICTFGYGEVVIIPKFMEIISSQTSNVEITITPRDIYSNDAILQGHADILFGAGLETTSKTCTVLPLFKDKFVCVMSRNHPLAGTDLTLDGFLEYPHAIAPFFKADERRVSYVDKKLEQLGRKRRIQKRSPHWVSSLLSLSTTNLLQSGPEHMAKALLNTGLFVIKELPFEVKSIDFELVWHSRHDTDPRHLWFRQRFIEAAKTSIL